MAPILLDRRVGGVTQAFVGDAAPAFVAYESLAPFYDDFTSDYVYDAWLAALLGVARDHGLAGWRVLDVACGTGKSFVPLAERGFDVIACDISPAMVEHARRRLPGGEDRVFVADMRALPEVGPVDLVTCLDDSVNYLLDDADLGAALDGMAVSLRPGGLAIFDVNSLATYRTSVAEEFSVDRGATFFCWRGEGSPDAEPGSVAAATVEVFSEAHSGCWKRTTSRHVQRHHPRATIEAGCALAGLDLVAACGQMPGGRLEPAADETQHAKVVYLARKADV
jgi:SAM-dependent methyltransferase